MHSSQDNLIWHIEKYRKKRGLSYLELSNQLHIPYTTLTETLRGKRVPRIDTVDILADAMGLDTYELFLPPEGAKKKAETNGLEEGLLESVRELPDKKKELLRMYLDCLEEID
ncbi:MAG: helix-turn-helix domain-containing protein [Lachnospiraceae bacterium]|nr:helix-turn-helix domain-containing protein [Lachnospiraceae bacterium]